MAKGPVSLFVVAGSSNDSQATICRIEGFAQVMKEKETLTLWWMSR